MIEDDRIKQAFVCKWCGEVFDHCRSARTHYSNSLDHPKDPTKVEGGVLK